MFYWLAENHEVENLKIRRSTLARKVWHEIFSSLERNIEWLSNNRQHYVWIDGE